MALYDLYIDYMITIKDVFGTSLVDNLCYNPNLIRIYELITTKEATLRILSQEFLT